MRNNLENDQALERMGLIFVILACLGALAVVGGSGWALYALWRAWI